MSAEVEDDEVAEIVDGFKFWKTCIGKYNCRFIEPDIDYDGEYEESPHIPVDAPFLSTEALIELYEFSRVYEGGRWLISKEMNGGQDIYVIKVERKKIHVTVVDYDGFYDTKEYCVGEEEMEGDCLKV